MVVSVTLLSYYSILYLRVALVQSNAIPEECVSIIVYSKAGSFVLFFPPVPAAIFPGGDGGCLRFMVLFAVVLENTMFPQAKHIVFTRCARSKQYYKMAERVRIIVYSKAGRCFFPLVPESIFRGVDGGCLRFTVLLWC